MRAAASGRVGYGSGMSLRLKSQVFGGGKHWTLAWEHCAGGGLGVAVPLDGQLDRVVGYDDPLDVL